MPKQHTNFMGWKPGLRVAVAALALVIIFGMLDGSGCQISGMVSAAAQHALVLLPSFVLTAVQTWQPDAAGHQHFSICAAQMLLLWPLLQTAVRAS